MSYGLVAVLVLACVLIFLMIKWTKELLFYRRNSWNFEIDNKGQSMGLGIEGGEPQIPFSNKNRVLFAYPLLMLALCIFTVLFIKAV